MSLAGQPAPKIKPISEEERAKNAWWFRQIATTLALGNAGGVVAISGFAGSIENVDLGMVVSYPAISFFFAGAFFAFLSFLVHFIYSFTRMEALAEHDRELNEWRLANNKPRAVNLITTALFIIYAGLMLGSLGLSGYLFYRGAASASFATAAIACAGSPTGTTCRADGAWLFVTPPMEVRARVDKALKAHARSEDDPTSCNVIITSESRLRSAADDIGRGSCTAGSNAVGSPASSVASVPFDK